MRGLVGTVVWAPGLGAAAVGIGLFFGFTGWYTQDVVMRYSGLYLAAAALLLALAAPMSTGLILGLLRWYRPTGARQAAVVALLPWIGPVAVWHWTFATLWIPPRPEPLVRRRKEEVVTAPPGWLWELQDTGPTPLPGWNLTDAATVSDRLPQVRALWELEPDRVATEEQERPAGRLRAGRGAVTR